MGMTVSPSVLVDASFAFPGLADQLSALADARRAEPFEVVLVETVEGTTAVPSELDVVRCPVPAGTDRREALALAAERSDADVCIALGPLSRPCAGFVAPLAMPWLPARPSLRPCS